MANLVFLVLLVVGCILRPSISALLDDTINEPVDERLHSIEKRQLAPGPIGTSIFFKYRWVTQCGHVSTYPIGDVSIQVSSTLSVPDDILEKASRLVYLLTRFMPGQLFKSLSQTISVGVFIYRQDQPSSFPEYTDRQDRPECSGRCDGECSNTCIEEGTKFNDQWYYNGPRILVASQNLNCDRNLFDDPQFGLLNLLVSEISRVTERLLPADSAQALFQSFQTAVVKGTWVTSTATTSATDYFIQGSLGWFTSTRLTELTTGRINFCGEQVCSSEDLGRKRIQNLDPGLYQILNTVYNNGRDYIKGGITVCTW